MIIQGFIDVNLLGSFRLKRTFKLVLQPIDDLNLFILSLTQSFDNFVSDLNFTRKCLRNPLLSPPIFNYLLELSFNFECLCVWGFKFQLFIRNQLSCCVVTLPHEVCKLERFSCLLKNQLHLFGNQVVKIESAVFDCREFFGYLSFSFTVVVHDLSQHRSNKLKIFLICKGLISCLIFVRWRHSITFSELILLVAPRSRLTRECKLVAIIDCT